jgi:outer membrane lipoprotein-sorting protein
MALLRTLAAFALLAAPAAAEPIPLKDISAYIESLRAVETTFTQVNDDGSTANGRLIIRRPNRMRFEYAPPDRTLVLASAGAVAIYDPKSNQPPEQYPLRRTPLSLILGRNVDLTRARMVTFHDEEGDLTTVTAQDPDHPEYGTIKLFFARDPVRLTQWIVTDEYGAQTTTQLDGFRDGGDYPDSLFSISGETERRGG